MRVYYDRHGHYRGYSVPLWLVILKWVFIVGLICLPVYGFMALFGLQHKPVTAYLEAAWLLFWLGVWQLAKRVR